MNDLQVFSRWKHNEIPIVNGIVFPNGQIEAMTIECEGGNRTAKQNGKTTLQELENRSELYYSNIMTNHHIQTSDELYDIYCGEGSYGGDGFIVVTSEHGNYLVWIAFFEDSNPFIKVQYKEDFVYGFNSLNEKWSFKLKAPTEIKIEIAR